MANAEALIQKEYTRIRENSAKERQDKIDRVSAKIIQILSGTDQHMLVSNLEEQILSTTDLVKEEGGDGKHSQFVFVRDTIHAALYALLLSGKILDYDRGKDDWRVWILR